MGPHPQLSPALQLGTLLAPRRIAVVGASPNAAKHTGRTVANLIQTGYRGQILPVNPRYDEVSGLPCHHSVDELPDGVDAAYILVRADLVRDAVQSCADRGIPSIIVCSSGFGELGEEGVRRQQELCDIAHARGSRVLGPNCIGVLNVPDNVIACPTLNLTTRFTAGGVSVVSQSGGLGVNVVNLAQGRGIGIRAFISSGNECDLDVAELVEALLEDDQTSSIALVVEQLRDAARFAAAAELASDSGTPLVLLKIGRSEVGRRSALGHTGAMAGEYAVFHDVIRQLGVLEVQSIDELVDAAAILALAPAPRGRRLVVVSPSGGECSYVADRAVERGLELPDLSDSTVAALTPHMPLGAPANPLDPTGQIIGDPALLDRVLDLVTSDESFDLISLAIPTWGAHDSERLLPRFIEAARGVDKPVALSAWSASDLTETADELLRGSGVPHFPSADAAVDALANLVRYHSLRPWNRPAPLPAQDRPADLGAEPGEQQAKNLVRSWGLRTPEERLTSDPETAVEFAEAVGWPVVAKLLCPGVHHKSDLGLVRTSISSATELRGALRDFDAVAGRLGLRPDGYLVCREVAGAEMIVGAVRDPSFGPVVMIGAGGVFAEHFADRVFRLCPLSVDDALDAVAQLRVSTILAGARGHRYDVSALAELIATVSSSFARSPWLRELDLNPVIVGEAGASIVDAVLALNVPD
ncbi:MAG: hypothetical protein QOH52_4630 [Pseudonocardiales bacterium]|nr:hypothetical protein [Pseudonocardiales bacterium]